VVPLLIVYLHPNGVVRVGWEPTIGSWCYRRKTIPRNQQAPITFLGAITDVSRDQSRSSDSVTFGNEERAHVETIDAVTLTEKLEETLETSRMLDISGDMIGF